MILFLFLMWRDWRFRRGLYTLELHTGPNTLSDHALALHLGLLQATLVAIGISLTIMGVISFRSIREAAREAAEKTAKEVARETAVVETKPAVTDYLNQVYAKTPEGGTAATVSIPVESELEREE